MLTLHKCISSLFNLLLVYSPLLHPYLTLSSLLTLTSCSSSFLHSHFILPPYHPILVLTLTRSSIILSSPRPPSFHPLSSTSCHSILHPSSISSPYFVLYNLSLYSPPVKNRAKIINHTKW